MRRNKLTPRQIAAPIICTILVIAIYAAIWTGVRNRTVSAVTVTESGETTELENAFNAETMTGSYAYIENAVADARLVREEVPDEEAVCSIKLANSRGAVLYLIEYLDGGIYVTDRHGTYSAEGEAIESLPEMFVTDTSLTFDAGTVAGAYVTLPEGKDRTLPDGITGRIREAMESAGTEAGERPDFDKYGIYSITLLDDAGTETARLLAYKNETWLIDLKTKEYAKITGMEECLGWIEDFQEIET